jgi:hypothetical protein
MHIDKRCILIKLRYERSGNLFFTFFLLACNHIESGNSLRKSEKQYILSLNLLDEHEKIYKFYSEYKLKVAGNFFTDKRIAKYWIDENDKEKDQIVFAYYKDIKTIDTIYNAGLTYTPYMLITKKGGSAFKVSVDGKKWEVKSFFEDALNMWRQYK